LCAGISTLTKGSRPSSRTGGLRCSQRRRNMIEVVTHRMLVAIGYAAK
jgi:hypothetical protein